MTTGPKSFVDHVELQTVLKKKCSRSLQMLKKLSLEWKHVPTVRLIEKSHLGNNYWHMGQKQGQKEILR